ncbi:hypothetical protein [Gemmatimonas aurantiaca]|nr:hypothetical protein [Gemmatimonas aurantiaca]
MRASRSFTPPSRPVSVSMTAATALLVACSSSGTAAGPADTPRSQSVRIGQVIQPTSGAPSFSLLSVDQDSRCPRSVVCVRMGDVDVTLGYRVGGGATVPFTLRWGAPPSDTVIAGTRVSLDSVTPWPETPGSRPPTEGYTAWLTLKAHP